MAPNPLSRLCLAIPLAAFAMPAAFAQDDCVSTWVAVPGLSSHTNDLIAFDDGNGEALYATAAPNTVSSSLMRWDGSTWETIETISSIFALREVQTPSGPRLWVLARAAIWQLTDGSLELVGNQKTDADRFMDVAEFDDGTGPQTFALGTSIVFRLDGDAWEWFAELSRGAPIAAGAIETFDDGTGPALYVGASFFRISDRFNAVVVDNIAKFKNGQWSAVGGGITGGNEECCSGNPFVTAMMVHDDGSGSKLYVAGAFSIAGGVPVGGIACWDGLNWLTVGNATEPNNFILGLRVLDLGEGPRLVAIGDFTHMGGVPAHGITAWDGSVWSPVGPGLTTDRRYSNSSAAMFDDGSPDGPSLFVGGSFRNVNGAAIRAVARLDCICPDLNDDGTVELDDLAVILASFGQSGSSAGDLNHDGQVSIADLSILLARFGTGCE